jgi:magnesium-protoporphyrin IX monomethyl ester (oxidative) cyclase
VLKDVIKKPLNLERVRGLIAYCEKIGLHHSMFLVIGMPGEKLSEMWESFRFAADCGCYFPHISVATPYPGTELYDICSREGYFSRPYSLDDLFIRSYLIRTPEFDENDIRKLLRKGKLYLIVRSILAHPTRIFAYIGTVLRRPSVLKHYLK